MIFIYINLQKKKIADKQTTIIAKQIKLIVKQLFKYGSNVKKRKIKQKKIEALQREFQSYKSDETTSLIFQFLTLTPNLFFLISHSFSACSLL